MSFRLSNHQNATQVRLHGSWPFPESEKGVGNTRRKQWRGGTQICMTKTKNP